MAKRDVSAQVTGGRVTSRQVQFDLQTSLESGLDLLRGLKQDLLAVLGVTDVQFTREGARFGLRVTRAEEAPVPLLQLMPLLPELDPATAVLGLSEEGDPVLLALNADDAGHALILGSPAAGKTTLLRTIAVSLALTNRQSQTQLLVISAADNEEAIGFSELAPLSYLPHLLEPVIFDTVNSVSLLSFLVDEVRYRLQQGVIAPTIVLLVDHLDLLLQAAGEAANEAVIYLLQHGDRAGVHLVMSVADSQSDWLTPLVRSCAPVRIVGRVDGEVAGRAATERPDTYAEYLLGEGDFLAVTGDAVTHFQAAFVGDYDLHLVLDTLHRNRPQPLLAQRFSTRSRLTDEADEDEEAVYEFSAMPGESGIVHEKAAPQKAAPQKAAPQRPADVAPQRQDTVKKDDVSEEEVIPFEVGRTSYYFEEDDQEM